MPKAKNLKYLRKRAALSQQQLADELGVALNTIRSLENKRTAIPRPASLRIANHFNIPYEEFCDTDLELAEASGIRLTDEERRYLTMFRALPAAVQDVINHAIEAYYGDT